MGERGNHLTPRFHKGQAELMVILIAIIAIVAIVGVLIYFNVINIPFLTVGLSGGVQILGLSNVQIIGQNQGNFSGSYFFAQLLLGGPFNPVQSASSTLASQINGSYTGSSQLDTISITTLNNQVLYLANGNAGSTTLNTYSASAYTGQFSYTNCNGQTIIATGSIAQNGWDCLPGLSPVTGSQAASNYENACYQAVGSQGNIGVVVSATGSPAPAGNSGTSVYCYQLIRNAWGNVYQLGQGILNSTIQVMLNGQSIKVSNSKPQAFIYNSTGKVLEGAYFLPQQAGTFFGPPSPQSIGVLFVNSTQRRLLQFSSFSNLLNAQVQVNSSVGKLQSQSQSTWILPSSLNSNVTAINLGLSSTMFVQPAGSYPLGIYNNGTNSYKLILNDTSFTYIRPQIEFFTSAQFFGFTLAQANCQIQPIQSFSFKSGSTYTLNVNVKNTGSASGACVTTASQYNTAALTITSLGSQTITIPSGATGSFQFQIASNQNINASSAITFQACAAASGRPCTNTTVQLSIQSQCSTGFVLVNAQCQPISTITVPTTTVCSSSCSTSTTVPAIVCTPPSVFNQTLFNLNVKPPCWIPPIPGPNWLYIAIVVGIVAIIIVVIIVIGGKHNG